MPQVLDILLWAWDRRLLDCASGCVHFDSAPRCCHPFKVGPAIGSAWSSPWARPFCAWAVQDRFISVWLGLRLHRNAGWGKRRWIGCKAAHLSWSKCSVSGQLCSRWWAWYFVRPVWAWPAARRLANMLGPNQCWWNGDTLVSWAMLHDVLQPRRNWRRRHQGDAWLEFREPFVERCSWGAG